jgi:hypothetical protein
MESKSTYKQTIFAARQAGLWYLGLAITGVLGFMYLHPQIFVSGDDQKSLANLSDQETLARVRLIFEMLIVITQALAALWFYRLFREILPWAAWATGIWGMVNAIAIMFSAMSIAAAIEIANSEVILAQDKLLLFQLCKQYISHSWGIGSLFFGLWLIPMGYAVIYSKRMPIWLGRILIIGGIGYILSPLIGYMGVKSSLLEILVIPASIGEFWMIGYLLLYGIRPPADPASADQQPVLQES